MVVTRTKGLARYKNAMKLMSAAVPTMMFGTELISVSSPPMLVSRPSTSRNPSSLSLRSSLSSGHCRERSDDDHRGHVVQDRAEQDGHEPIEPEKSDRVAARRLREPDRDPGEEPGARRDVHEQAGPKDDRDHTPVDRRDVYGHAHLVPADKVRAVRERQQNRAEKQRHDRVKPDDERLLRVQLLFQREAHDERHENGGKEQRDAQRYFGRDVLGCLWGEDVEHWR